MLQQTTFGALPLGALFYDYAFSGDWCRKTWACGAVGPACASGWEMSFQPAHPVKVEQPVVAEA